MNIYNDSNLSHPLNDDELAMIDLVWDFVDKFHFNTLNVTTYRKNIINLINESINEDDFFIYEKICEKLYWNLRNKVKYLFDDQDDCIILTKNLCQDGLDEIMELFHNDNSYRSFINKLVLIDDVNKQISYKKMEGSSHIFNKNKLNDVVWIAMNKLDYEKMLTDPKKIQLINSSNYYYGYDYGLPNLNFGKPFMQSDDFRMRRIKKMYYDKKSEENWFKLIM